MTITALYNRTFEKAKAIGEKFGISNIYDNAETLLDKEQPDFADIITDVDTHAYFTKLAAERHIDVICQKPMAPSLAMAGEMVKACASNNVRLFIHENFPAIAHPQAERSAMQALSADLLKQGCLFVPPFRFLKQPFGT